MYYYSNYSEFFRIFTSRYQQSDFQMFLDTLVEATETFDTNTSLVTDLEKWYGISNWGGHAEKPKYHPRYGSYVYKAVLNSKISSVRNMSGFVSDGKRILRMLYNLHYHYSYDKKDQIISDKIKYILTHFCARDKYSKEMKTLDTFLFHKENGRVRHQGNYNEGKKFQKEYKNSWQQTHYSLLAILQTGKKNATRVALRDVIDGSDLYGTEMAGRRVSFMQLHHILFTDGASHDKTDQPSIIFGTKPTLSSLIEMLKLVPLTPNNHTSIHNVYRSGNIQIYNEYWDRTPSLKPYYLQNEIQYNEAIRLVLEYLKNECKICNYTSTDFPKYVDLMLELNSGNIAESLEY